jgi:L-lysine exporter family protein LysE/ArgO
VRSPAQPLRVSSPLALPGCALLTDPAALAMTTGFVIGLGLTLSIGPQNLQLIRAGATGRYGLVTATSGFLSEIVIVLATITWLGGVLDRAPQSALVLQVLGVCFLVWCGGRSLIHRRQRAEGLCPSGSPLTLRGSVAAMLCVTWLNPLVYLEVGLVAGSVSLGFDSGAKSSFAVGLLVASAIKFYGWTALGSVLSAWLGKADRMTWFNLMSGSVLILMATALAWHSMA